MPIQSLRLGKPELLTISRLNNERPDFGGLTGVTARYQEDGELLVINAGSGERGFAVCLNCGYSESELTAFKHGPEELSKSYEHHAPLQFAPTKNGRTWVDCRKHNGKNDVSNKRRSSVGFSPRFSEDNASAWAKAHATRTFVG